MEFQSKTRAKFIRQYIKHYTNYEEQAHVKNLPQCRYGH